MYYSYILKSLKDGRLYYAHTANLQERLKVHNCGKVKSTKGRIPFEILYYEEFETRVESCRRELFFKSIEGYKWLKKKKLL